MTLLGYYTDDRYLFIHTNDVRVRKLKRTYTTFNKVLNACKYLIGKKIRIATYGDWNPDEWFYDIQAIDKDSNIKKSISIYLSETLKFSKNQTAIAVSKLKFHIWNFVYNRSISCIWDEFKKIVSSIISDS